MSKLKLYNLYAPKDLAFMIGTAYAMDRIDSKQYSELMNRVNEIIQTNKEVVEILKGLDNG